MSNPGTPNSLVMPNIQDALNEASLESKPNDEIMKNFSLRLYPSTREKSETVCQRHGTTLSAFLRKCAESLAEQYPG